MRKILTIIKLVPLFLAVWGGLAADLWAWWEQNDELKGGELLALRVGSTAVALLVAAPVTYLLHKRAAG